MSERMTDERLREMRQCRGVYGCNTPELLDALLAERAEVARLDEELRAASIDAERADSKVVELLWELAEWNKATIEGVNLSHYAAMLEGSERPDDDECIAIAQALRYAARLMARCARREGDPSVEQVRLLADPAWIEPDRPLSAAMCATARVALRAWGEEATP